MYHISGQLTRILPGGDSGQDDLPVSVNWFLVGYTGGSAKGVEPILLSVPSPPAIFLSAFLNTVFVFLEHSLFFVLAEFDTARQSLPVKLHTTNEKGARTAII